MNTFAGTGSIIDVKQNGKVTKFTLADEQGKPCFVPCVVFDTSEKFKNFIEEMENSGQVVWLQGRISSHEYEFDGKTVRKIEVISYASAIRAI